MSVSLKEVFDGMVDIGIIFPGNEDDVMEFLNKQYGLNVHHDLIITSHEAREIRGLLSFLQDNEDEYIRKSSKWCIERLTIE